jgi:hypothetical protein
MGGNHSKASSKKSKVKKISKIDFVNKQTVLCEDDGTTAVQVYTTDEKEGFLNNWGENVQFRPAFIFNPKTKAGVCNIVKWAREKNLRIRACGYRHTWNNVYADFGQILVSLLGMDHIDSNHSPSVEDWDTGAGKEFRTIEYLDSCMKPDHIHCRIGGAVTNDELRRFCDHTRDPFTNSKWTLPLNVILVENTISGTVSSICHGAGGSNKTISDLVVEIEFVNAKGELQAVNQVELLRSAAGSFGLLGVITSITLQLDKMAYAHMDPKTDELLKGVPPPKGFLLADLPSKLQQKFDSQTHLDLFIDKYSRRFFDHCNNDYYCEWFWFILNKNCWINNWVKVDSRNLDENELYWSTKGFQLHKELEAESISSIDAIINMLNNTSNGPLSPSSQQFYTKAQSQIFMMNLGLNKQRLVPLSEAIHFQRGIRHMKCRDCEIEIPVKLVNGKPDWTICQVAWWDAIKIIYDKVGEDGTVPINLALEMRIMSGSNIIMVISFVFFLHYCFFLLFFMRFRFCRHRSMAMILLVQLKYCRI